MGGLGEGREHGPVQVAPGRLAGQQHDGGAVPRTLVDVVHPQRRGVGGGDVDVVRLERIAGQLGEAVFGGTQYVHQDPTLARPQCPAEEKQQPPGQRGGR